METEKLIEIIGSCEECAEKRLSALAELKKKVDLGEINAPPRGIFVNNHIHTSYSFSPYTPTSAVFNAWKAGLSTA